MADNNTVFLGTELKLKVSIDPITSADPKNDGNPKIYHMEDYNFEVKFYCNSRNYVTMSNTNGSVLNGYHLDSDNYIALIDTALLDKGDLKCTITAYIPDAHYNDKLRTEVYMINTGITIVKSI